MKKRRTTIIMVLFFFMGLLVLLYPSLSDFYNQKHQSKTIVNYEELLSTYQENDYQKIFNDAINYNNVLKELKKPLLTSYSIGTYNETLNVNNNGMMGYITIDKIKVELPIYHGTSEDVLNKAVGHIEGTSLPIGGIGSHSVLSAHRGLPSSKLFTDLDKLEIGDTFTITILNKLITYEVDKIVTVKPNQTEELKIDKNNDYVTLLTCTPYGINTHRLLVRGKRIDNIEDKKLYITTESFKINSLIVTPIVAIPIIFILLLIIIFKPIEKNTNNLMDKYIYPSKYKENKSLEVDKNEYKKY